jgi:hypothetical protein
MIRIGNCIKLRTLLSAVAALGISLASSAQADPIIFNPTGGVASGGGFNPGNMGITSFNWGSGDALAVASISGGGIVPGSTFQLYYQTKLIGLNTSGGGTTPAGLNAGNGYQITEVASFTELVSPLSTSSAAIFTLNPTQAANSGVKIYYEDLTKPGAVVANADTGAGFIPPTTAGTLIFNASLASLSPANGASNQSNYTDTTKVNPGTNPVQMLNPLTPTNYSGVNTDQGTGSTVLSMVGTIVNTSFFITPAVLNSQFSSNLRNNFADIGASLKFNDPSTSAPGMTLTPTVGSLNGVSGPDFLLEVSGATQNFSVPEPASLVMALSAMGIVPLATWRVRRNRRPQA